MMNDVSLQKVFMNEVVIAGQSPVVTVCGVLEFYIQEFFLGDLERECEGIRAF
jgi:hypothetical protein